MPENWLEEMVLFEGLTLDEACAIHNACRKRLGIKEEAWHKAYRNRAFHMYEKWQGCKVPGPICIAMSALSAVLLSKGETAALECLQGLWPRQSLTGS